VFPTLPGAGDRQLGLPHFFVQSMFLPDLIRRHHDPADDFHLDFHKMVCIAFKTDGGMPECNTAVCNGIHTTSSTSASLMHGEWLCLNARSMFIARSSSGCMQRLRRGQRDGLRINGGGRAGCYVTSATAWPAATTARRGHIDINAALPAAAGRISICRTAFPCLPSTWRIILSG